MTWIQSAWSHEVTHVKHVLNSVTWTDLNEDSSGCSFICENHCIILVIANSIANADIALQAGNYDIWGCGDRRVIPTRQTESSKSTDHNKFYAKCFDADETGAINIAAVAIADAGLVPGEVVITSAVHGFAVGDYVTIAGCTGDGVVYNGTFRITAVPAATTFRIIKTYVAYTPAGGAVEVCSMSPTVLKSIGMP